jgi:hypothetical protein
MKMKKQSFGILEYIKNNRLESAGAALILIITFLFSAKCVLTAMTSAFSFDGGITIQAAQNMAKHFRFATSYFTGYNDFCGALTTGLPVVAPIALLFKISGESFSAGLLVNALYMILLFLAVAYYIKYCLKLNNFFVLLALLLFYGTKDMFDLGFGIYGEIPMCFYILAGAAFVHKYSESGDKKNLFIAGIFIGLGFITKIVTLIIVPALIFAAAWDYFAVNRNNKAKAALTEYAGFICGFLIPAVVVEIYKLCMLGFGGFINWWTGMANGVSIQGGIMKYGRMTETYGIFLKYNRHLDLLAKYKSIDRTLIIVLLYLLVIVFIGLLYYSFKYLKKKNAQKEGAPVYSKSMIMIMALTLTYFIWWILIAPTGRAWYRRIITGVIFYKICLVYMAHLGYVLIKKYTGKLPGAGRQLAMTAAYIAFMMLIAVSAWRVIDIKNNELPLYNTGEKDGVLEAANFIKALPPEAQIYGFAWWQAPNIAFASGKVFKNIMNDAGMETLGPKHEKYLVVDKPAMINERDCIVKLAEDYENKLVFSNSEARLYRLDKRMKVSHPEECN